MAQQFAVFDAQNTGRMVQIAMTRPSIAATPNRNTKETVTHHNRSSYLISYWTTALHLRARVNVAKIRNQLEWLILNWLHRRALHISIIWKWLFRKTKREINVSALFLIFIVFDSLNTHSCMVIRRNEMSYRRNRPNKIDSSARKINIAAADK